MLPIFWWIIAPLITIILSLMTASGEKPSHMLILNGKKGAGKTATRDTLMGRKYNANTKPTIKEMVDQNDTFLIYDDSGSDDNAKYREKTRKAIISELNNHLKDIEILSYIYVFNSEEYDINKEDLRYSINHFKKYIEYEHGNNNDSKKYNLKIIGTRGDKISIDKISKIENEIRDNFTVDVKIFDMTKSPKDEITKFLKG